MIEWADEAVMGRGTAMDDALGVVTVPSSRVASQRHRARHSSSLLVTPRLSPSVALESESHHMVARMSISRTTMYSAPSASYILSPAYLKYMTLSPFLMAGGFAFSSPSAFFPGPAATTVAVLQVRAGDVAAEAETLLRVAAHPRLVRFLGQCTEGGESLLLMEYAPLGDLRSRLEATYVPVTARLA